VKRRRQVAQHAVGGFFFAEEVALKLQAHVLAPEHAHQPVHQAAHAVPAGHERFPAGDGDEAGGAAVVRKFSAPSPFGAPSFMRVSRRQRFW
jgi:hypothetical protein